ncbi:MAG: peptidylprolyl isomerase [Candidatus Latescibacterota bacterium]|nr:peptidylprolyl isomerase [Candidatus Latescibacterota bacterium]
MLRRWGVLMVVATTMSCAGVSEEEHSRIKSEVKSLRNDLTVTQRKLAESEASGKAIGDRFGFLAGKLRGIKARIETNHGDIEVEFYPEKAPIHVFNFVTRAESGFYDGTMFHRVIKGFMIQGGDPLSKDANPTNDGSGGPIASIPHEFNDIKHVKGILSMARTGDKRAGAGSQFFIMHAANPGLNGQYTAFGNVTGGLDIVDKIATTKTSAADRPVKNAIIRTIEVFR